MASILVIGGDETLRAAAQHGLRQHDHAVAVAGTGLACLEQILREQPEVVMLDLAVDLDLPAVDATTLVAMIRAASDVPIMVVTGQENDPTVVAALDVGADDYLVKPIGTDLTAARVRALLRRSDRGHRSPAALRVGELAIDQRTRGATLAGQPIDLTRKEFELLALLMSRAGEVVTKQEALAEVWQLTDGGSEHTVDVHLSWLRRKLGESAAHPRFIHTVRGVGVRLVDPDDAAA